MNNNIINEIRQLCDSFDTTYDFYEKGYIWYTMEYLKRLMPENNEINNMYYEIAYKVAFLGNNLVNEDNLWLQRANTFMKNNNSFFKHNIPVINKVKAVEKNALLSLQKENLVFILSDFLKSLGNELYDFYEEMFLNKRIIFGITNNTAFTSLKNNSTIIFIQKFNNLYDAFIFVHELSHAYYIKINNQRLVEQKNPEATIKSEIPAKIMELKFIKFLADNMVIEPSSLLQNEFDFMMYTCSQKCDDYQYFKYFIASYLASKLDNNIDITKYYQHIYKSDIHNLILELNNKHSASKVFKKYVMK